MDENILSNGDIEFLDDLVITDDELYCNNTFNLKALNDTLEKLSVTNFWSLYELQRSRFNIKRFSIPFNNFLPTKRLMGENKKTFYPKRHIAYVDCAFIAPELRKKYRNSAFYNVAVNQDTISKNQDIFESNYLVFINGEYIFTTEVYPIESRLGVIIDLQTKNNEHGISLDQYNEYRDTNPNVDIIIVPNFNITNLTTNKYVLESMDYSIPFDKFPKYDEFNENTVCFANSVDNIARRYYENGIKVNLGNSTIDIDRNISPGGNKYLFTLLSFNYLYDIITITGDSPYFQLKTSIPCPTEHMVLFIKNSEGRYIFYNNEIKLYYPNIYEVCGLSETDECRIIIFHDDKLITGNEKYFNEVSKYEEYCEMLPQYKDNTIPEIIKSYRPSSYVYSIGDYNNSIYVPSTLNYKVQKLHKTIYENPWALAVYLDLLNLPTDKFYLDMEKIDLSNRLRKDTTMEVLDDGIVDSVFAEDMYVFAMNRHFVNTRTYGFRIFIDGYFQTTDNYAIIPGPDFYYIYLPTSKIKNNTVVEIERYKLFSFESTSSTNSLDKPLLEFKLSDKNTIGYSREIYVVDKDTNKYLLKGKDFSIDVLYRFAEGGEKWVTIPLGRNIPIENEVRVNLLNDKYLNRTLKIGINRTMSMKTGKPYVEEEDELHDFSIFQYEELRMTNQGGYDIGGYRMFNNGKLMIPDQYFVTTSRYQGEEDLIRTSCELFDGDKFTIDRVPARFVAVYYQNEIDEENKKGFVDVDGKLELPISLKWYDIYLNGVKLNKKNIEIISPTKFYVQGVESRKHLLIVMKNRDPEVFKLADHNVEFDNKDYNNTIMDDLMEIIGGIKDIIDDTKEVVDPNNEVRDIASHICLHQDALIFFYQYFVYTFINANYKQITQEIKDAFPDLINDKGIMEIDSNMGCDESSTISGYLIKLIECNYLDERSEDMFTSESIDYSGLGALQDRFAIRPLNTNNYEFGLPQEFMCDPETGEPAIMNDDGTVTTVSTLFRTKNFIESFSDQITMYGMGKADIYQVTFDEEFKVHVYSDNENLLTEDIATTKEVSKLSVGLDVTFLTQVGDSKMLRIADIDPMVEVTYIDNGRELTINHSVNRLHNYIIESDTKNIMKLRSIKINGIPKGVKTFVHSLLIAF